MRISDWISDVCSSDLVAFEVFLEVIPLPRAARQKRSLLELAPFQPVSRDFAFLVDEDVPAEKVVRAARGADKALIAEVALFDVYRGKGVEPGKKDRKSGGWGKRV